MPQNADSILLPQWIIPVESAGDGGDRVLENHALVIDKGRIIDLLPIEKATAQYQSANIVELPSQALIPGLVNAHTHAAMSLMRGLADDLPLMEWLEGHIWPAEARLVKEDFVRDGVTLAAAEMLRSGTTCFNDMYFFPDVIADTASRIGIRACVGLILLDFPTIWAATADEYLDKGIAVHDRYKSHPLITTAFAPHAPYTVSDEPLKKASSMAFEMDIPLHMHVHETAFEVSDAESNSGKRPLSRLDDLGLLNPQMLAVHMTQLNDGEIQRCAEAGLHVIHCPQSNLKLASGFCPVDKLQKAGVNVALGTDGAASNNDLDMLAEMQSAALLTKAVSQDASALPAHAALHMATLAGAQALGLADEIGSLTIGKAADITAIDLSDIETQPVFDPVSQIVYSTGREQISNVWVAGQRLLNNRELTSIDQHDILQKAYKWGEKIGQADDE